MNLGQNQGLERGSSSRRKCIITAVKARLAEEENMHQVSMALRAFFTREMRTSRRKGRSRLLCTVAEFTQNSPIIIFPFICMYCIIENKIISCFKVVTFNGIGKLQELFWKQMFSIYRGSPDSTNFGPPGDRTIAKIVLSGDWFSTKIGIWDF